MIANSERGPYANEIKDAICMPPSPTKVALAPCPREETWATFTRGGAQGWPLTTGHWPLAVNPLRYLKFSKRLSAQHGNAYR